MTPRRTCTANFQTQARTNRDRHRQTLKSTKVEQCDGACRTALVSSSVTDPRWRPSNAFFFNHVFDPCVNRVLGRIAHEDMRRMEAAIRASDLDWTIVRPSGLFDYPDVTRYVTEEGSADGLFTARSDLATAMLQQLTDSRFVRKAMGVVTTQVRPNIAKLIWTEATRKRS